VLKIKQKGEIMKKYRKFWLFNIKAKSSRSALKKARQKTQSYGDVVRTVRLVKKKYPKGAMKTYSAFGGKKY